MQKADTQPPFGTYKPPVFARALLWVSRRSFLGLGKWRELVFALFSRLHEGIVDTHIMGAPIRLDPRTNLLERFALVRENRIDRKERVMMHSYLREPDSVLVDVGSNLGLYAIDAISNSPGKTRVLAIEANPTMASRLAFNLSVMQSFGVRNSELVSLETVAVGEKAGFAPMAENGAEHLSSLFQPTGKTVDVAVEPLLALVEKAGLERIDYLKIDIEGYEGEALGPFLTDANDHVLPRCIQIEDNASDLWTYDLIALMKKRGYRQAGRAGMNAFWQRN